METSKDTMDDDSDVISAYERIRQKNINKIKSLMSSEFEAMRVLSYQVATGTNQVPKVIKPKKAAKAAPAAPCVSRKTRRTEKRGQKVEPEDPSWSQHIGLESTPRASRTLRPRTVLSYIEQDIPNVDRFLFCDICQSEFMDGCPSHPPMFCSDEEILRHLEIKPSSIRNAGRGMWTVANAATIRVGTHFGPYKGARLTPSDYLAAKESGYAWEILDSERKKRIVGFVDPGPDPDPLPNWMAIVNSANHKKDQNMVAVQYLGEIFYRVCRDIRPNKEILTYYGDEYSHALGIDPKKYKDPTSYKPFWDNINPHNLPECTLCGSGFATFQCFEDHGCRQLQLERIRQREGDHVCQECGGTFNCKWDLARHEVVHSKSQPFECDRCGKRFGHKHNLTRHISTVHGERKFPCATCGKKFTLRQNRDQHVMAVHEAQKNFICLTCGSAFSQKGNLQSHNRDVHNN